MRNVVIMQSRQKIESLLQEFELLFPAEAAVILIFQTFSGILHT